uniref:Uncharacterized protein n=1 Tax=Anguilla anguilla TaxID=7936 RepID=A0A0E9T7H3_ANGAN
MSALLPPTSTVSLAMIDHDYMVLVYLNTNNILDILDLVDTSKPFSGHCYSRLYPPERSHSHRGFMPVPW